MQNGNLPAMLSVAFQRETETLLFMHPSLMDSRKDMFKNFQYFALKCGQLQPFLLRTTITAETVTNAW